MIDEFTKAHGLSISVESGLLVLLSQRLIHQGHSPADLVALVQAAVKYPLIPSSPPEMIPEPPEPTLSPTNEGLVVAFRPNKRK
jgi:hypothetical protein